MKPKQNYPQTSLDKVFEESDDDWVGLNEKYTHIYKLTPYLLKWKDVPISETFEQISDYFYDEHADESDEEWVSKNFPEKNKHSAQALCCAGCFITIAYHSQIVFRHKMSMYFTSEHLVNCHIKVQDVLSCSSESKRLKCSIKRVDALPMDLTDKQSEKCPLSNPLVLCNNCECIIGFYDTVKKLYTLQQAILSPD
ncbi:uncharacterized protein LOC128882682 isoform X2 [Hylaeus volcanicus]|uniref:uncharacterized protein LOC128882682 isoform X2 n=1 Tax=Hylaeus volcanicus TaxID=313075 RepID=UPI0023B7FEB4|nr:uncharacterized protein LOC128882682 isoform X2 [Hylaeus volcanicus]